MKKEIEYRQEPVWITVVISIAMWCVITTCLLPFMRCSSIATSVLTAVIVTALSLGIRLVGLTKQIVPPPNDQ